MKVQKTVWLETRSIAVGTFGLTAAMLTGFAAAGRADMAVVLGGLYAGMLAVLNFFVLGMTVQASVSGIQSGRAEEVRRARLRMQLSYVLRMAALFGLLAVGIAGMGFHPLAVVAPLVFPRITIFLISMARSRRTKGCEER